MKRIVIACVTGSFILASGTALAGNVSVTVDSIKRPSLKSPDTLEATITVENGPDKILLKMVGLKLEGTDCSFSKSGLGATLLPDEKKTATVRTSCPWSKIAAVDGCGADKNVCEVAGNGRFVYSMGGSDARGLFNQKLTLTKPGPKGIRR